MNTHSHSKNKRKLVDEEDTGDLNPLNIDSGDEISGINYSGVDLGSSLKQVKVDFDVRQEFQAQFDSKGVATRKILLGKPIVGKAFELCGVVKLFSELGFHDFFLSLSKNYYPSLVRNFMLS